MSVKKRREAGFTLIEVMITVVIIALLAGVALPAYQGQIVKSRRTDTQRVLVSHAQSLERWFSTNGTYLNAAGTACGVADPATTTGYTVGTRCTATTFIVTSTVVSGSSQASDGNQVLTNAGVRTGKWAE
ncbi:prepilin-type N-terminal cleavage/methylation domain-containing protein [Dechloromonas denitrificans]|uniref:type IV pilin protein n=1 Tax=Dechloromonas denitrificans TaxID=281362 RepID=UPI001CF893A8|nr:type IV pilin protein [Dechloromonas denitrificans]UCV11467.1 prepilin-type N-terminal cleavage/methylation domain-containing protein [Dechloromonas denitrificans]